MKKNSLSGNSTLRSSGSL